MRYSNLIIVWMITFTVLMLYFFSTFRGIDPLPKNALAEVFVQAFIFSIPATLLIGIIMIGLKTNK